MRAVVVSSKDLMPGLGNPTGCWNPRRYTGGCHLCGVFHGKQRGGIGWRDMPCKPKVVPSIQRLLEEQSRVRREAARVNQELEGLAHRLTRLGGEL